MRQYADRTANSTLWRYLSLEAFLWMLSESRLRLSFPSGFTDPFEGQYPRLTAEGIRAWTGTHADHNRRMVAGDLLPDFAVLCFHRQREENELMWRAYGSEVGVAFRTTVRRVKTVMSGLVQHGEIELGDVKYVDYEHYEMDWVSHGNKVMHKRREYRAERECRVIISPASIVADAVRPEFNGLSVPVDLNGLISEVVVAPRLNWLVGSIADLCALKGLRATVRESRVSQVPYRIFEERAIRALIPTEIADSVSIPRTIYFVPDVHPAPN